MKPDFKKKNLSAYFIDIHHINAMADLAEESHNQSSANVTGLIENVPNRTLEATR